MSVYSITFHAKETHAILLLEFIENNNRDSSGYILSGCRLILDNFIIVRTALSVL